jgi:hypothetical protein
MIAIALAHWFADSGDPFGAQLSLMWLATVDVRVLVLIRLGRCPIAEAVQRGSKCHLNLLGIRCGEPVFERERLMGPSDKSGRFAEPRGLRK